ncbi:hypothetical protein [Saccharothrix violaceirubra]|uniref:Uncharacterized protein n=1 Tax=Saccharothrix violaceirubra TaxID=413306 RepID=A0A7W7T427_9PSEU|nr:hypothetical protein [Saccharothrix violaceirubra]MBB4965951.1 hypothetical protein [Saccharothrix violaceirubra]
MITRSGLPSCVATAAACRNPDFAFSTCPYREAGAYNPTSRRIRPPAPMWCR